MTSDVIAKATYPGGTAVTRRSSADRVRAWIVLLMCGLPSAGLITVLLYGLGTTIDGGVPGMLPAAWFVVCACWSAVCFRGSQRLPRIFRLRKPTSDEERILRPAWQNVARKADVPAATYTLWMQEADRRLVVPDRMITVSAESLRLTPRELEAVLVHQLAQRVQGRAVFWQLLFRHYNLPVVWIEHALMSGLGLIAVGDAIARRLPERGSRVFSLGWTVFSRVLVACPTVAAATATIGLAPAVLLRLVPEVVALALRPIADRFEYRTDRMAVDLGYGAELGGVLKHVPVPPTHTPLSLLSVSLFSSKTSPENRIRRIRDRLDELARRWTSPTR